MKNFNKIIIHVLKTNRSRTHKKKDKQLCDNDTKTNQETYAEGSRENCINLSTKFKKRSFRLDAEGVPIDNN